MKSEHRSRAVGHGDGPHLRPPRERVCDTVAAAGRRHGERVAVVCGTDRLTYRELLAAAGRICRGLRKAAPGRIAVLGHRTVLTPAYLLAVHLSGRAFVLLDPNSPERLRRHVLTSTGVRLVLDPRTVPEPGGLDGPGADGDLADEAYVLHTSGSTGLPKGVSVTQRNLASSNQARLTVYQEFGTPCFLLLSPFFFDSSVAGTWGTLAAGGCLVIATEEERRDPTALTTLVERHRVTHTLTVPSFHAAFLHAVDARPERARSLRVAICAGERLPQSVLRHHFATCPAVPLINEYGPTECTVWSTYRKYHRPGPSTIGVPIPGTSIRLVDENLGEVADGEAGQIAISGPGVALGYVGDAAETRQKFVDREGAGRTYLTGDIGRWTAGGELEFLGRLDNQAKVRGVRINLDTVEQALGQYPGVQAAALAYDSEAALCHAFLVGKPHARLDEMDIRSTIEAAFGTSHVPDRLEFRDALPRTARDKVDRGALLNSVRTKRTVPAARSESDLPVRIARAWETVLGIPVQRHESVNFFDLGGNSISVLELSRVLAEIAGKPVPVGKVYRCGTIDQQVNLLRSL
ncbi:non-ribosomal peptide synthetase [Amycolatopsis minnesotensis]|uniref:Carrier domain-containing protein n=1 Tax=Amycolatopsis minnesotensis TaxID=337894 RepID=A0ABN2RK18_9PSEU